MFVPLMLHVGHATNTFEGVLTFAGLGLSGLGLGAAVLALQRAMARRGRRRA